MNAIDFEAFTVRFERARELNARARSRRALGDFEVLLRDLQAINHVHLDEVDLELWAWLLARSWMGIAEAEFALTGDLASAGRSLDQAAAVAKLIDGAAGLRIDAVAAGQRGMILRYAGRPQEAVPLFDRVLEVSDTAAHRDLAIAHLNRGVVLSDLGDFERALADDHAAAHHASAAENPMLVAWARHNAGFIRSLLGDAPAALADMAAARAIAPDQDDGIPLLGRAEVLYGVGLLEEAEALLADAIPQLLRSGMRMDRATAEYFRARCLLSLQRFEESRDLAELAHRHFVSVGSLPWAVLARVLTLEASYASARRGMLAGGIARRRAGQALAAAQDGDLAGPVLGQHPAMLRGSLRLNGSYWRATSLRLTTRSQNCRAD